MNAPGSPSSPLQMMYLGAAGSARQAAHFLPVGKPAPPRPRRPDAPISATMSSGAHLCQGLGQAEVAVPGDVFVDALGVDASAIAQDDEPLVLEELDVGQAR